MKRSVVLSVSSFDLLAPAAAVIEQCGLDRAWVTETPGRDALVRAVHTVVRTPSIGVGTGIAYAFSRHPVAMASAAIDASMATGGRFTLGVGAGPAYIRTALGVTFDEPAARLGEYIAVVRAVLAATDGLRFDGRFYRADLPSFTGSAPLELRRSIEIYGSGLNPLALRTVAGVADGIALHPLAIFRPYLDTVVLPAIAAGAGDRSVKVACWCVTGVADDPALARSRARTRLAVYLANPAFTGVLRGTAWEPYPGDLQAAVRASPGRTDWDAVGQLLPDDLVDALAVVGRPDEVRDKLADLQAALVARGMDELALQVPSMAGSDRQLLTEIGDIAAAAEGVPT